MKEDIAVNTLKQVKEVFDEYGIEFWLESGTLLGAVRDKKFIPWEHDIDLGTWDKNAPKIASACKKLERMGFTTHFSSCSDCVDIKKEGWVELWLYHKKGTKAKWRGFIPQTKAARITDHLLWILSTLPYMGITRPKEFRYSFVSLSLLKLSRLLPNTWKRKLIKVLVFLYEKTGCRRGWYLNMEIPSHFFDTLSNIEFFGMNFKIPSKIENYLAYRYGKRWRTPKKKWDWCKEDGAIAK